MSDFDVKKLREELDLTQEQFGELIGVSRNTVINYEGKGTIPDTKSPIFDRLKREGINEDERQRLFGVKGIKKAPDENRSLLDNEEDKAVDYFIRNFPRLMDSNELVKLFYDNIRLRVRIELMSEFDRK